MNNLDEFFSRYKAMRRCIEGGATLRRRSRRVSGARFELAEEQGVNARHI